jgi:hypothetical protein
MKQNPNTIYLACGDGHKENVEKLMLKYNIDLKRVVFTGQVNPHMYGWVIDVWPDSFPLGNGQSKDEFIAKKRPVIFHSKRNISNDKNSNLFVGNTDNEYIILVNKLVNNEKYKNKIRFLEYKLWFKNKKTNFIDILKGAI